jgi:acyl-CoA synthetase (AMP-forming)/AMP-acid ligase II
MVSVAQMLLETAKVMRDKAAVVTGESTVSYADLATRSLAIAEVLAQTGVKAEDRVAILLTRGAEAASAFFGTVAAGAIAINVNESLRWRQIEIAGHGADAFSPRILTWQDLIHDAKFRIRVYFDNIDVYLQSRS